MKKGKFALLGIVSLLLLFVVFIPIKAEAAAIIKPGKTIALKLVEDAPLYKMTLEDDALVKVEWTDDKYHLTQINIYCDSKKKKHINPISTYGNIDYGYRYIALKKGVYYLEMSDGNKGVTPPTTKVCFSWTPIPEIDQGNYCVAKAPVLKYNKPIEVVQTPRYNCDKYYEINLTKESAIQIKVDYRHMQYIRIYSGNLDHDYFTSYLDGNTLISDDVLPPGTYYIVIRAFESPYQYGVLGDYWTFKWKYYN